MVDRTDDIAASAAGDDELSREIANLKHEISRLRDAFAERRDDLVGGAQRATQAVRDQASAVGTAVRENPGTVSSAFVLGGIVGVLVGLALSQVERSPRSWYDRFQDRWH